MGHQPVSLIDEVYQLTTIAAGERERLWPLWRVAWWLGALFVVASMHVMVRLDVQELRQDIDRVQRQQREARIVHERLQLESDVRRRSVAVERAAEARSLGPVARVVVMGEDR